MNPGDFSGASHIPGERYSITFPAKLHPKQRPRGGHLQGLPLHISSAGSPQSRALYRSLQDLRPRPCLHRKDQCRSSRLWRSPRFASAGLCMRADRGRIFLLRSSTFRKCLGGFGFDRSPPQPLQLRRRFPTSPSRFQRRSRVGSPAPRVVREDCCGRYRPAHPRDLHEPCPRFPPGGARFAGCWQHLPQFLLPASPAFPREFRLRADCRQPSLHPEQHSSRISLNRL